MTKPKDAPGVPAPVSQVLPELPADMYEITAQDAGLGVSDACGPVSMAEYAAARELHAIIKRGAYRVEMPAISEAA